MAEDFTAENAGLDGGTVPKKILLRNLSRNAEAVPAREIRVR
jgi:hypothetical protein